MSELSQLYQMGGVERAFALIEGDAVFYCEEYYEEQGNGCGGVLGPNASSVVEVLRARGIDAHVCRCTVELPAGWPIHDETEDDGLPF